MMALVYALIIGIGLAYAYHEAKPLSSAKTRILILADSLAEYPSLPIRFFGRWLRGISICVVCLSFWTGLMGGMITLPYAEIYSATHVIAAGLGSYIFTRTMK